MSSTRVARPFREEEPERSPAEELYIGLNCSNNSSEQFFCHDCESWFFAPSSPSFELPDCPLCGSSLVSASGTAD